MAEETGISWATSTFNPWIGCTRVSPGCDHCYAETLATNRMGVAWGPHAERRRTSASYWAQPHRWNRKAAKSGEPWRVFCCSLADVFDNRAPEGARDDLWQVIRTTPALTWMLLTKRPQNIAKMLPVDWGAGYPNVWLGTTVENQEEADRRVPVLLGVPARLHFLSCEPLLGPVSLEPRPIVDQGGRGMLPDDPLRGTGMRHAAPPGWVYLNGGPRVGWVIAGGESGPRARPMHPDWARSLRDQCAAAGVPFHFKQWGEWAPCGALPEDWSRRQEAAHPWGDAGVSYRVGTKAAGHVLDGAEHQAIPA